MECARLVHQKATKPAKIVCSRRRFPASLVCMLVVVLPVLIVPMATGQIVRNENPCLSEGGVCAVKSSCPEEFRFNRTGLCPEQEPQGAICCAGLPTNVDSCHQHGGRCGDGDACRNVQNFGQLDCEDGSRCCLLIF